MNLSPAEAALIEVIRLSRHGDLSLTVTRASDVFVVTAMIPEENGLMMGAGPTLDAAVFSLIGAEPPGNPGSGDHAEPPEPARALRLVGGTHAPADAGQRCEAAA